MTKEEYLNRYKEDKLAEICAQYDKENDGFNRYIDKLVAQNTELSDHVETLNKKCEDLDVWDDTEKVFTKLKSIPAKDFIKLYYMMQGMMNNHERYDNTCVPKPNNWDKIITTISSR